MSRLPVSTGHPSTSPLASLQQGVRQRQHSAWGQHSWRQLRLAAALTLAALVLTLILPGAWRNLLAGTAACAAAFVVVHLHWRSVGGRRFWRWTLIITIGMMFIPFGPVTLTGRILASITLGVLLIFRPYRFLSELGSGRRALTGLGSLLLLIGIVAVRGPAEAGNEVTQVLRHLHGLARFVLVTFLVMTVVWLFLGVRLHFLRMRPKLAVAGMLLAAVPVGLMLSLGLLGGWTLLGAGRAEQVAAVMADWLDLAGSGDLRGPGPFGQGFGDQMIGPHETPLDVSWREELADAVAHGPFDPMPPAIWLNVSGELWVVRIGQEARRPVLVGARRLGRDQIHALANDTGCEVGLYDDASSRWSLSSSQGLATDSGLLGQDIFADTGDSAAVMIAWPDFVDRDIALGTRKTSWYSAFYWFGGAQADVWQLKDQGLARSAVYIGLRTRMGDVLSSLGRESSDYNAALIFILAGTATVFLFLQLLAFYFGIRIVGGVTGAVGHLHKATERMARGDLATTISVPNEDEFGDLADSFNEMTAAIRIAQEQIIQKQLLEAQLDTARGIQERLLPASMPRIAGYQISGSSDPSSQVGGDYFDFVEMPDGRLGIAVADVTGKGVPAALLMANVQAGLHGQALHPGTAAEIIARMNNLLYASTDAHMFVTFALIMLDPASGEIESVSAGHEPTLLIRPDGSYEKLEAGGLMLGMMPGFEYSEVQARMDPGDVLVLYTDGVTEAMGPAPLQALSSGKVAQGSDGEPEDDDDDDDEMVLPFFEDHRLVELCVARRHETAEQIRHALLAAIRNFAQDVPQSDDITIVVIKRESVA